MPKVVWKPQYYAQLLVLAVPLTGYFFGRWLQSQHDKDFTRFRNQSQLYGGRKESVW